MHIFHTLFFWTYHNVWGNLVASALTASIAYFRLKAHHDKQQAQLKEHINYQFNKLTDKVN